jgi:hypothetical protein
VIDSFDKTYAFVQAGLQSFVDSFDEKDAGITQEET